jgi:hypothetical protein
MNKRALVGLSALALCGVVVKSQEPPIEYGPQVVLKVDHSAGGKMWVVPQAKVWFRIGPVMADSHPAPLSDGTLMLCRPYDLKATNGTFLAVRCGFDSYIVQSVGMRSDK